MSSDDAVEYDPATAPDSPGQGFVICGTLLAAAGVIAAFFAFNMRTDEIVGLQVDVANAALMQRQLMIMLAAVGAFVAGIVCVGFGYAIGALHK